MLNIVLNKLALVLYVLSGLMLLALLCLELTDYTVDEVWIRGQVPHTPQQAMQTLVDQYVRGNFLTLNLNRIHDVFRQLPWIRTVAVHRKSPHALEIELHEHQALAFWGEHGLVSIRGEFFSARSDAKLPVFYGPSVFITEMAQQYQVLRRILLPLKLGIAEVHLSARKAWLVIMENGMVLVLGRTDINTRLQKFVRVYQRDLTQMQHKIRHIDLRYKNGFAVRNPDDLSQEHSQH